MALSASPRRQQQRLGRLSQQSRSSDQDDGMSALVLGRDEVLEVLLADYREFSVKHSEIALCINQLFASVNSLLRAWSLPQATSYTYVKRGPK